MYTIAIWGIIHYIKEPVGLMLNPLFVAIFVSAFGITLGYIFFKTSFFKTKIKNYMLIGIAIAVSTMFIIPYILFQTKAMLSILVFFIAVMGSLILSIVPIIGVYGLFKKQKNLMITCGILIMTVFCISRIINDKYVFSEKQIHLFILYIITFVIYLEFGFKYLNCEYSFTKITPNKENIDTMILSRYNKVLNKYLIYIVVFSAISYIMTLALFWNNLKIGIINSRQLFGIDPGSIYMTLFLTVLMVISIIIFWISTPHIKINFLQIKKIFTRKNKATKINKIKT